MKIGFILKQLRLIKGVSQQCIAEKLNVERSTYSKWESEKVILRIDQLHNLATIYGLELSYMGMCVEAGKIISPGTAERLIRIEELKENKR